MTASLELERARHIHGCLATVPDGALPEYARRLKGAPAELMDNGLLQTLAFYRSKKGEHPRVAGHLEAWLTKRELIRAGEAVLVALSKLEAAEYRRCSEEAIAWLNWAKRLALAKAPPDEKVQ